MPLSALKDEFSLEEEVLRATRDWYLAHPNLAGGVESRTREATQIPDCDNNSIEGVAPLPATTFADVPLGSEFVDEDGCTWEKRSETRAMLWMQYEPVEFATFSPTDRVRLK